MYSPSEGENEHNIDNIIYNKDLIKNGIWYL